MVYLTDRKKIQGKEQEGVMESYLTKLKYINILISILKINGDLDSLQNLYVCEINYKTFVNLFIRCFILKDILFL